MHNVFVLLCTCVVYTTMKYRDAVEKVYKQSITSARREVEMSGDFVAHGGDVSK